MLAMAMEKGTLGTLGTPTGRPLIDVSFRKRKRWGKENLKGKDQELEKRKRSLQMRK